MLIVYYVPRRTMRVIAWRATMLAGDRSRGAISSASIVASLVISRIVCIGTYSILCDFGAYTTFYAYTRIKSSIVVVCGASHYTWYVTTSPWPFWFYRSCVVVKKKKKKIVLRCMALGACVVQFLHSIPL